MSVRVLTGDCRDIMRAMDADSIDCIVTSPPYWGLRDYGIAGQLGLESSLGEHIATMVDVFEAARRVLKKSGTLWLNYGDCYAAAVNGRAAADTKALGNDDRTFRDKPFSTVGNGLKPKDLCMVPARLAIALQEASWWLRSEIIWHKPNPMPESTRDRPTSAHEKIYLLAKSERYFYDAEAIAEDGALAISGNTQHKFVNDDPRFRYRAGFLAMREKTYPKVNKRNVWTVPSSPFSDAHFATFPPALIEPCILAGCPAKVCAKCGKPWLRQTKTLQERPTSQLRGKYAANGAAVQIGGGSSTIGHSNWHDGRENAQTVTLGFRPSCHCHAGTVPGTVLDPFGGAGTTGLVADRLGRNAILIELNESYSLMARRRLEKDAGMFAQVELALPVQTVLPFADLPKESPSLDCSEPLSLPLDGGANV